MNTPTKEQIDAAKAWACSSPSAPISAEQYAALEAYVEANKGTPGLWQWSDAPAFILLAALESAEAKVEAMASRESASVSKEIETSADMLAQVQNAEARVKELEQQLRGTMQAGGYDYFSQQLQECERYWGIARNYAEQMKKKLEAAEADSARLPIEALGFAFAWACTALDEGKDPREVEVPALMDAWGKAQALAARKAQP